MPRQISDASGARIGRYALGHTLSLGECLRREFARQLQLLTQRGERGGQCITGSRRDKVGAMRGHDASVCGVSRGGSDVASLPSRSIHSP